MDRREFIKDAFLWSAGLSLAGSRLHGVGEAFAAEGAPVVAMAESANYAELVPKVLAPLGGMAAFVSPGDKVVIKPNMAWDRLPEHGANTHPVIVRALAEQALAAGAAEVLVFDRPCNEERRCYTRSGIMAAIKSLDNDKVRVEYIDYRKFMPVEIEKGKVLTKAVIYRDVLEADSYINVPVAKHHGLSGLTLGLKNSMGVLGGNRGKMHNNIGQKLADLATVVRPKLTFIDATRLLLRNGPQGGSLQDVKIRNAVLASTDPVAADAYATTLFGIKPEEIESTVAAYKMGLGEMRLDKINLIGA